MLHIICTSDEEILRNCADTLGCEDVVVFLVDTLASKISDEIAKRLTLCGTRLSHIAATDGDTQKLNSLNSLTISYDDFVTFCTKHPNILTWY